VGSSSILNLTCAPRFVDHNAFARSLGIGIGCQRLQATQTLEIVIGPNAPDPMELTTNGFDESLFNTYYKFDNNDDDLDGSESL
jgi:hypothetical protein